MGAYILSVYCLGWAAVLMWVLLAVERCCVPQTDDRLGKLTKLQSMKVLLGEWWAGGLGGKTAGLVLLVRRMGLVAQLVRRQRWRGQVKGLGLR